MNQRATERRASGKLVVGVIAVVVAIAVATVLIFRRDGEPEVPAIDPDRRAQLYERELRTFDELCVADPPRESRANCLEAARLLEQYPECDAPCRERIEQVRQRSQPQR